MLLRLLLILRPLSREETLEDNWGIMPNLVKLVGLASDL